MKGLHREEPAMLAGISGTTTCGSSRAAFLDPAEREFRRDWEGSAASLALLAGLDDPLVEPHGDRTSHDTGR